MKRIPIRNNNSPKLVKPRVFDALIDDEGEIFFESKVNKQPEVVSLQEVLNQIEDAENQQQHTL